mmetsp:Transcript_25375/g.87554  ORF Transcript_25375/g.87554 Transcript_25375/m.87554 type:complete len:224 (+) Transcript_25375:1584-2255(+)
MHEIDDDDGHVAERRAARPQVRKCFVARRVDDHQAGQGELCAVDAQDVVDFRHGPWLRRQPRAHRRNLLLQSLLVEKCRADLLRDAAGLAVLHVGLADFVEELRLAGVDVAHDAADGRAEAFGLAVGEVDRLARHASRARVQLLDLPVPLLFIGLFRRLRLDQREPLRFETFLLFAIQQFQPRLLQRLLLPGQVRLGQIFFRAVRVLPVAPCGHLWFSDFQLV